MVHWSVTRIVALVIACVGMLGGAVALAGTAQAAEDEPTGTIQGFLRDLGGNPVPGVDVTATDAEGFSGTGTSDDAGRWEVEVPGPGTYAVELDVDTLPEGVAEPTKNPIENVVVTGSARTVLFTLGERERDLTSKWDQAAQLTVEGLRFGLIIALAAVGLSLIYGTTGLTNFAHGEIVTFGAVVTWWLNVTLGIPFILAAILGHRALRRVRLGSTTVVSGNRCAKRQTGLIAMMIVSIGLALACRTSS